MDTLRPKCAPVCLILGTSGLFFPVPGKETRDTCVHCRWREVLRLVYEVVKVVAVLRGGEPDDLAQSVIEKLLKMLLKDPTAATRITRQYLFSMARSCASDAYRGSTRKKRVNPTNIVSLDEIRSGSDKEDIDAGNSLEGRLFRTGVNQDNPESAIIEEEERREQHIEREKLLEIMGLTQAEIEVIILEMVYKYDTLEIAEALGVTPQAVNTRRCRALAKIKGYYNKE